MHPEIEAAIIDVEHNHPDLNAVTLHNAELLLTYIEDLNLARTGIFMPTPAQSLYIMWSVNSWEFHMECIKSGNILYAFNHAGKEEISGTKPVDEFILQLETYLLKSMS
jgi:hypothetical protein